MVMKLFSCLFVVLALSRAEENPLYPLTEYMRKQAQDINGTISPDVSANISEIVDQVVGEFGDYFVTRGLDPLELRDIEEGLKVKILLVTYSGELKLTKGFLNGLSTVERAGEASLHYDKKFLRAKIGFLFEKLTINYRYLVKIMGIGPTGHVHADVRNTKLNFDIVLDLENSTFYLQDFNITKIGKIKVKFEGNEILDTLINPLTRTVSGLFEAIFRGEISAIIENVIKDLLKDINNMPKDNP